MTVASMLHTPAGGTAAPTRRGMLLLLVVSVLTLFIVIGAVAVLIAMRARESARAFAAASAAPASSAALARAQLDAALIRLIAGPSQAGDTGRSVTESLLEDKYGTSSNTCSITGLAATGSAVIQANVTGISLANPATIAGRVLTFVPAANDPTRPTSYRILGVNANAGTLQLANVKPTTPIALPTVFPCEAVINGREFVAEPYDAFDEQNSFLTWPVLQSSTVASIRRPAFGTPGAACTVDNDGDGVADGIWLNNVLPPQRSPDGGQLTFEVSYLVLDLDGRINLNAHGSFVRAQTVTSASTYPNDPTTFPVGLGYGPADVDATLALAGQAAGSGTNRWALLLQGGTLARIATASTATQWRPSPMVEALQPGRYGHGPGSAPPGGAVITGTMSLHSDAWLSGNSPTDLKARLQVFTEGSPPVLTFSRPTPAWNAPDTDDVLGSGTAAHPYRMRLDEDAPRDPSRVGVGTASDVIFTAGELERVLRPFDTDASTLAPRLALMLDDLAERSRMTVTTDSWDTPAITGTAATRIGTAIAGGSPYDVLSPESVAGLRFNLNRPLVSGNARQDYFRQLYTLVVALSGTANADAAAQWVANVIEFRDPDSTMTRYPYDTNPLDGWATDKSVWGMERPEMVITSAPPPPPEGGSVSVELYRPWGTKLCLGNSTAATGTTERIDANLGNQSTNTLDVTRAAGGSAVWRLLVVNDGTTPLNTVLTTATAVGTNTSVGRATVTVRTGTQIELQRLADPSAAEGASNPYVTVHAVPVPPGKPAATVSRWLHWPNRDFVSHAELLTVPSGSPGLAPEALFSESNDTSFVRECPAILDATIVPSRFVCANVSVASGSTTLAGTGYENFQHSQFSRWREAGRVNVNTILPNPGNTGGIPDDVVWRALIGPGGAANPVTAGNYNPIKADRDLLVTGAPPNADAVFPRSGGAAASGFLKRSTAIRLANTATIRSHVFAVWITVRITDSSSNAGTPQVARLFAIVDRSIPVGYVPGRTLNVRETIRLQRFLP